MQILLRQVNGIVERRFEKIRVMFVDRVFVGKDVTLKHLAVENCRLKTIDLISIYYLIFNEKAKNACRRNL